MRQRLSAVLTTTLAAAAWAQPVVAQGKDPKGQVEVDAQLGTLVDAKSQEKLARVEVRGKTGPFPDGTTLFISLRAKGGVRPVSCALFRAVVSGGRFQGGFQWPGKELAPLLYEVRIELPVGKQPESAKRWFVREYGFGDDHIELLVAKDITVGKLDERAKFGVENVKTILKQLTELDELRARAQSDLVAAPVSEPEKWKEAVRAYGKDLLTWKNAFDAYRFRWVVLLEDALLTGTLNALKTLVRAIDDHGKARPSEHLMKQAETRIRSLKATLAARLPLQHPEDKDKDPKEPEKDKPKEGP